VGSFAGLLAMLVTRQPFVTFAVAVFAVIICEIVTRSNKS